MCRCGAGRRKAELVTNDRIAWSAGIPPAKVGRTAWLVDNKKRIGNSLLQRLVYRRRGPKAQQPRQFVFGSHMDEIFPHQDRRAVLQRAERSSDSALITRGLESNC